MTLVKEWLTVCNSKHFKYLRQENSALPDRVIDVGPPEGTQDPHLIDGTDKFDRYAALSYRWGTSPSLRTLKSNISSLHKAIPMSTLPHTLRDAIIITRLLGLRYLWIDALCIIQDCEEDWNTQSTKMGRIYANSWICIAAGARQSGNGGIFKPRNPLEIRTCMHPTLISPHNGSKAVIYPSFAKEYDVLDSTSLSYRGWIVQERALSKRILHWSEFEVLWECNELQASERRPQGYVTPPGPLRKFTETRNFFQRSKPIHDILSDTFSGTYPLPSWQLKEALISWYETIIIYSRCALTVESDKLPAISGLARLFAQLTNTEIQNAEKPAYVAGIWVRDFIDGLSWARAGRDHDEYWSGPRNGHHDPMKGLRAYRAPSFSWASLADEEQVFYYNRRQLDTVPEYNATVLDYDVTVDGTNPFGRVSNGWVKLRAFVSPFSALRDTNTDEALGFEPIGVQYFDFEGTYDEYDKLVSQMQILRLFVTINKLGEFVQLNSLILLPTENNNEYQRVGFYFQDDRFDLGNWKEMEITII
jgi:heterokaryon incompatibility protein (HET)